MDTKTVSVEHSGRILIPAAFRRKLGIEEGTVLTLTVNDKNQLLLETREAAIQRIQAEFRKKIPEGRLLSEELIQERRLEAEREAVK